MKWFCLLILTVCVGVPSLRADVIALKAGDVLRGRVVETNDTGVVLDHPVFGRMHVPIASVKAVLTDAEASKATTQPGGIAAVAGDTPEVIKAREKTKAEAWKRQVELGSTGSNGATDDISVRAAFKAKQKDEEGRWEFNVVYNLRAVDNATTRNELTSSMLRDWYFGASPWFITTSEQYDFNKFAEYEHRLQGAIGPGYRLLKDDKFDWVVRSGLGARQSWPSDSLTPAQRANFNDDLIPEASLGSTFTWRINPRQTLEAGGTFYFDIIDPSENRSQSKAEWQTKVDPEHNLDLKIGLTHEYLSQTIDTANSQIFKFYVTLVYGF